MSVQDYLGRSLDVVALSGATLRSEVQLQPTLLGGDHAGGEVCTGIQKLCQQWVVEFLTARGSCRFVPRRGNQFLPRLYAGTIQSETDIQIEFGIAALTVSDWLRQTDTALPADERIQDAQLVELAIDYPTAKLKIRINSLAGESRAVLLPVTVSPLITDAP